MPRDPETGQFVASSDGAGPEDPYLNTQVIASSNKWGPQNAADPTTTFDEIDGRDSLQAIELDRPDDHLIEIHGFSTAWGDPAGDGSNAKMDLFVVNDDDPPAKLRGWPTTIDQDDDLIYQAGVQSNGSTGVGQYETPSGGMFKKPVLSTGKLGLLARNSPSNEGGEMALSVYYTYREFDDQRILRQLLESR